MLSHLRTLNSGVTSKYSLAGIIILVGGHDQGLNACTSSKLFSQSVETCKLCLKRGCRELLTG